MYYQLKHSEGFSSRVWHINVLIMLMLMLCSKPLCGQSSLSPLHVDGPFLVNAEGRRINLHGFAQTFSPWFNEQGTKWTNYDVNKCLSYNKGIIDGIMNAGWKMTFVRQHMDPYWSNTPGKQTTGENDISAFDFERFKTYLDLVFIPMAEYAIQKGLYVVMRPPGVCPENIQIGDDYHQYLKKVWGYVAQHPKLKDNGAVLFELANEPVHINNGTRDRDEAMTQYMQEIVDLMRQYCNNILLIPGLGWQSNYAGFAKHPIKGENIGYAVHCYPGWYNSGHEGEVHTS
jgi:aryl-phospho-beta-D-glucosidase BglC (GH1 family)